MEVVAYNPGHDGAVAYLRDGRLVLSLEAEKDSNYRYTPLGGSELLAAFGHLERTPDVLAVGGWWPRDDRPTRTHGHAGYRGVEPDHFIVEDRRLFGAPVKYFSSSHERSHLLCSYGMSPFPQGQPCYALIWEGEIGAFYEIDADTNITLIADVLSQPGNRYATMYGLADPTFPKDAPFSRLSDAGKLMALASYATRNVATADEEDLIAFLLSSPEVRLDRYADLASAPHLDVGLEDAEFRNFAGIFSDRLFDTFHQFAAKNLHRGWPLLIGGGCGLNCDWNSRWVASGLFEDVFVPPVANDSGSAIGTAVDAQRHFTGNAKITWDVYSGLLFDTGDPGDLGDPGDPGDPGNPGDPGSGRAFGNFGSTDGTADLSAFDVQDVSDADVAAMLEGGLILGWVNGRYEAGPRALGNRSILAAPFENATRIRLNDIKQREQYRPIAPVCLASDAADWFGCTEPSPHMLYTFKARTDALAAVTHINGTARLQTVTPESNERLADLLLAFKALTGYGVLCNTSLNLHGRGFINNTVDLAAYVIDRGLDGFVLPGRAYLNRASPHYAAFRDRRTAS